MTIIANVCEDNNDDFFYGITIKQTDATYGIDLQWDEKSSSSAETKFTANICCFSRDTKSSGDGLFYMTFSDMRKQNKETSPTPSIMKPQFDKIKKSAINKFSPWLLYSYMKFLFNCRAGEKITYDDKKGSKFGNIRKIGAFFISPDVKKGGSGDLDNVVDKKKASEEGRNVKSESKDVKDFLGGTVKDIQISTRDWVEVYEKGSYIQVPKYIVIDVNVFLDLDAMKAAMSGGAEHDQPPKEMPVEEMQKPTVPAENKAEGAVDNIKQATDKADAAKKKGGSSIYSGQSAVLDGVGVGAHMMGNGQQAIDKQNQQMGVSKQPSQAGGSADNGKNQTSDQKKDDSKAESKPTQDKNNKNKDTKTEADKKERDDIQHPIVRKDAQGGHTVMNPGSNSSDKKNSSSGSKGSSADAKNNDSKNSAAKNSDAKQSGGGSFADKSAANSNHKVEKKTSATKGSAATGGGKTTNSDLTKSGMQNMEKMKVGKTVSANQQKNESVSSAASNFKKGAGDIKKAASSAKSNANKAKKVAQAVQKGAESVGNAANATQTSTAGAGAAGAGAAGAGASGGTTGTGA